MLLLWGFGQMLGSFQTPYGMDEKDEAEIWVVG